MRHGLTMMEILIVIAIISVLAGLLMPAIGYARLLARGTLTAQRCDDVLRAVGQLANESESASQVLHRALAANGLPGIVTFKRDIRWGELFPASGDWIPIPYPPWCFAHPWGRIPTDLPGDAPNALPTAPLERESHDLSDLTPLYTVPLLRAAGLIEDSDPVTAYRSNRASRMPWNDGWGRPLVVGLGMYHPRRNLALAIREQEKDQKKTAAVQRIRQDLFHKRAQSTYGFTRAFYLSVGSIGTGPSTPLTNQLLTDANGDWDTPDTGILAELWRQIHEICNQDSDGNDLWTSDGDRDPFSDPPWNGIKRGRVAGRYAFLSAPQEVR